MIVEQRNQTVSLLGVLHMNQSEPIKRLPSGRYCEPRSKLLSSSTLKPALIAGLCIAFFLQCLSLAQVDLGALVEGMPRLARWAAKAWPPYLDDLDRMLFRAAETVAIATVATVAATLVAFPLSIFISRNLGSPHWLALPVRGFINGLRGVDTVVFAILFVAAVGLGPFAGVLGMTLHAIGVIAKLNSEAIETLPKAPLEAAALSGASQTKIVTYAVLPASLPSLASVSLYVWEANVRTSTILGIVGAGGIGIEIKAAIDLLDFQKLFTLTAIVLVMVTVIDQLSSMLRRKLV
ncbi:phosphonate ABC transporter, permease protein PhnE [Pseudazoarcus pumilus]|uniref:Phosphonate ABC transporter, permease protein PhnE n=1 Tax=Pseudazoarcus pumilus TaxID=2067960 RepID=A0A2I6S5X5_9RHOO|nr:phosphonate ABC transporter, permease protein PhnE [Pseudazoarcus pumilus]AUN94649.1 phosphonate ABC transporter, permease protein PhnE [Pseudazoarcus pumilus]